VEIEKMSDIENILSEREQRYGSFKAVSETVQAVKDILASRVAERGVRWSPGATEAREMIAHKLGRVVNGDWRYVDTWKDIAGYALLVVAELDEEEK
jgi:ribose 1,5-bisphosphokinase PhnN